MPAVGIAPASEVAGESSAGCSGNDGEAAEACPGDVGATCAG